MSDSNHARLSGAGRVFQIAGRLKDGATVDNIAVREFLRWFNASRRGFWVVKHIDNALKDAGIETVPYFNQLYLDGRIGFRLRNPNDAEGTSSPAATVQEPSSTDEVVIAPASDPTIRLSRLAAANKSLVTVKPDALLAEAVTQMLNYDYSQLPVMTGERDVKGVVSWKSIGTRICNGIHAEFVRDAIDSAVEAPDDVSLFAAIPIVVTHDYVLVRASDKRITGIVTASDLGLQFRQLAEPFLLLGEIENYVRRVIAGAAFTASELSSVADQRDATRKVETVEDMTFGEYRRH